MFRADHFIVSTTMKDSKFVQLEQYTGVSAVALAAQPHDFKGIWSREVLSRKGYMVEGGIVQEISLSLPHH